MLDKKHGALRASVQAGAFYCPELTGGMRHAVKAILVSVFGSVIPNPPENKIRILSGLVLKAEHGYADLPTFP